MDGEEEGYMEGKEQVAGKYFCFNGVCHLVVAAGCRRGDVRQMDHEYCLDTRQPDALHLLSLPCLLLCSPLLSLDLHLHRFNIR